MDAVGVLGAIAWDPEIRNILALLFGFAVLCGSVYLLLATNTGARVGLLVAMACLFGWMVIMGLVWWIYGIGMLGRQAGWDVIEINRDNLDVAELPEARTLPQPSELPDPNEVLDEYPELEEVVFPEGRDNVPDPTLGQIVEADPDVREELGLADQLGGWRLLVPSDPQRGDASATADAVLGPDGSAIFESTSEYRVLDVFDIGGKPRRADDADMVDRAWHKLGSIVNFRHPVHYAVVQVQGTVDAEVEPGEAPPPPEVDPEAPVVSVIMVRDLGDRRLPAALITIVFAVLFALTCNALHRRDKLVARHRATAG